MSSETATEGTGKKRSKKPATAKKATSKSNGKAPEVKASAKVKTKSKSKKAAEPKAKREPAAKDQFGLREGSLRSKAAAMYANKKGATLGEITKELGSPQLNVLKDLEKNGYEVVVKEETGDKGRPVKRFFLKGRTSGAAPKTKEKSTSGKVKTKKAKAKAKKAAE